MKYSKKADNLVWIMIAVFILSFIIIWISNILNFNREVIYEYADETDTFILTTNAENILKKIDTSEINEWDVFYIFKDENEYKTSTWEIYKYIDRTWNNINPESFEWNIFTREITKWGNILEFLEQEWWISWTNFQEYSFKIDIKKLK